MVACCFSLIFTQNWTWVLCWRDQVWDSNRKTLNGGSMHHLAVEPVMLALLNSPLSFWTLLCRSFNNCFGTLLPPLRPLWLKEPTACGHLSVEDRNTVSLCLALGRLFCKKWPHEGQPQVWTTHGCLGFPVLGDHVTREICWHWILWKCWEFYRCSVEVQLCYCNNASNFEITSFAYR